MKKQPDEVGQMVLTGITNEELYILTDDLIAEALRSRAQQLEEALALRRR